MRLVALVGMTSAAASREPNGASLVIQFADGSNQFRVGQVIPLNLIFKATVDETYIFSTRSYDRSGRLDLERFEVSPPGRDPLYNYFHDGLTGGYMGGGLYSLRPLGKDPQIVRENVNEWMVLDEPGHYTLRVISGRVSRRAEPQNQAVELTSNVLEFEVIKADRKWQERTLEQAKEDLANPAGSKKRAGEETLRYLDSRASIRELARQLTKPGDEGRWEFTAGLLGSRYQKIVFRQMEARLTAPDAALTQDYLWLLARMMVARSNRPLPPYPQADAAQQKIWEKRQDELLAEVNRTEDALYQRAADLLAMKDAQAKAATAAAILLRADGHH